MAHAQGLKTLPLRLEQHARSAARRPLPRGRRSAGWRAVRDTILSSFAQHALARRQRRIGGGIVTFDLAGDDDAGAAPHAHVPRLDGICTLAESLGAAGNARPRTRDDHASYSPKEERAALGITDATVQARLGFCGPRGEEDPFDVERDLAQALERAALQDLEEVTA
ncbi:MAG: PLP-dependent transferase [Planctomycetota bacterium]